MIGVHSAKFETEKDSKNIARGRAPLRDRAPGGQRRRARDLGPLRRAELADGLVLIDPEGNVVWGTQRRDRRSTRSTPFSRRRCRTTASKGTARRDAAAVRPGRAPEHADTPLRFPGKVLADEAGDRLFIADSNHNRIVVARLDGTLVETHRLGRNRRRPTAISPRPRSTIRRAWPCTGDTLYVADTENHLLRKVDLDEQAGHDDRRHRPAGHALAGPRPRSSTIAAAWPAQRWVGPPARRRSTAPGTCGFTAANLYIAMAGPHQIWKMPLDESEIGPYAGNGREDIVDGPLLPREPYRAGLRLVRPAQRPGVRRQVALRGRQRRQLDPRRAVRPDADRCARSSARRDLPVGRLFTFGDVDGAGEQVRLQHCAGRGLSRRPALRGRHLQQQDQGRSTRPRATARRSPARASRAETTSRPRSTSRPGSAPPPASSTWPTRTTT